MRLLILSVGRPKGNCVETQVLDYLRRLGGKWKVEWKTVRQYPSAKSPALQVRKESERLLEHVDPRDYVVLLDEIGEEFDSRGFATWIQEHMQTGQRLVFIIGGPEGVSRELKKRADQMLRLSPLTLPHDLALLLLAEQLYRAYTILAGHPYHR